MMTTKMDDDDDVVVAAGGSDGGIVPMRSGEGLCSPSHYGVCSVAPITIFKKI